MRDHFHHRHLFSFVFSPFFFLCIFIDKNRNAKVHLVTDGPSKRLRSSMGQPHYSPPFIQVTPSGQITCEISPHHSMFI